MLISVNCWPSPLGDGTTDVNIEYEADLNKSSIEDVIITIPFPVYESLKRMLILDLDQSRKSEKSMEITRSQLQVLSGGLLLKKLRMVDWSLILKAMMWKDSILWKSGIKLQSLFARLT